MADQGHKAPIIVKKIKKVEGGAHGGSWKVAYADFVTAMMAFFLLMWLLNMTPPEKQEELAKYFNEFSMFEGSGQPGIPMESGGVGAPAVVVSQGSERPDGTALDVGEGAGPGEGGEGTGYGEGGEAGGVKELEEQVREQVAEKIPDLEGQVKVNKDEQGKVRIEIMDKTGKPIFQSGSTRLTNDAKRALKAITDVVKRDNLKVGVEGHTDSTPYPSQTYTNWELSTQRALSARQALVKDGLNPDNIVQVAGYAATRPYDKENPADPKNRRISLLLYEEPASGELKEQARPAAGASAGKPEGKAGGGQRPAGQASGRGQISGEGRVRGPVTPLDRAEEKGSGTPDLLEQQIEQLYDQATDEPL